MTSHERQRIITSEEDDLAVAGSFVRCVDVREVSGQTEPHPGEAHRVTGQHATLVNAPEPL